MCYISAHGPRYCRDVKKSRSIYEVGKSQGMILSLSTMLLWWEAERNEIKQKLDPGWRSRYDAISECIEDVSELLEDWKSNNITEPDP